MMYRLIIKNSRVQKENENPARVKPRTSSKVDNGKAESAICS